MIDAFKLVYLFLIPFHPFFDIFFFKNQNHKIEKSTKIERKKSENAVRNTQEWERK